MRASYETHRISTCFATPTCLHIAFFACCSLTTNFHLIVRPDPAGLGLSFFYIEYYTATMLTPEEVASYKTVLEEKRAKLLEEISESERRFADSGDDVDHADEEADEAGDRADLLTTEGVLKERITAIDAALSRIATGTFGACTTCGNPIESEVLAIDPESALCSACKKSA